MCASLTLCVRGSEVRLKVAVRELMRTGDARDGLLRTGSIFQAARPLFPRIEALATKLMAVANLNRTVHLQHYNRIIAAAGVAIRDAQQQPQQ
jgi:hypothetical protein